MATEEAIKRILDATNACIEMPNSELISRPAWGTITFDRAQPEFDRMRGLLAPLKILPISILPDSTANAFIAPITALAGTIKAIREFKIEQANPSENRDAICTNLKNQVDAIYVTVSPHIPYMAYERGDVEKNISRLVASTQDADRLVNDSKISLKSKAAEIESIVQHARDVSANAGVAVFTKDFSDEAERLGITATLWLRATGLLAAGTLICSIFLLFVAPHSGDTAAVVQQLSSKLIAVLTLLSAALWTGKIYKAVKHQEAVNRHRANAMRTFQAFSNATENAAVKDAVLLEATKSIFSLGSTGYFDGQSKDSDPQVNIFDIIKPTKSG